MGRVCVLRVCVCVCVCVLRGYGRSQHWTSHNPHHAGEGATTESTGDPPTTTPLHRGEVGCGRNTATTQTIRLPRCCESCSSSDTEYTHASVKWIVGSAWKRERTTAMGRGAYRRRRRLGPGQRAPHAWHNVWYKLTSVSLPTLFAATVQRGCAVSVLWCGSTRDTYYLH
jgi:hypothetical protein